MNHRERVLTTLRHQEPDRVPIDLGGTDITSIMTGSYRGLRQHLGLGAGETCVADIEQQVVVMEEDVRQALGVDVMFVSHEPNEWRKGSLADGSPVEFPAKFLPKLQDDGSHVIYDGLGNVVLKKSKMGHDFYPVYSPLAEATSVDDIEKCTHYIENYDTPFYLDKTYEELAKKAKTLRENTDYLLVGQFGGHILQGGLELRGWETFMMDLLVNPKLAEALMDKLVQAHIRRFERYAETVGQYIDVVMFYDDLGSQAQPLVGPELYRKMIKPYQKELFSFAKSKCDAYLLFHSDGAIAQLIPDLIEMEVDALNPLQVSAEGMDTKELKREFGQDICFWGGGCNSQTVLPFGTPEQIADEARRRIDDLAPGGGFVFASVQNIQDEVPPENIAALFETALEYGAY